MANIEEPHEYGLFPQEVIDDYWAEQRSAELADLEVAEEHLAEIEAQHRSECALYGDSWPGAIDQIDRAFAAVVRLRRLLGLPALRVCRWNAMAQRSYFAWEHDESGERPTGASLTDDIPF